MKAKIPNERTQRLSYIRALEKFMTKTASLLKNQSLSWEIFTKNIEKYYQELQKIEAVRLDSEYLQTLERFINTTLGKTSDTLATPNKQEEIKNHLQKELNLVEKEKNKTTYKKSKHKGGDFFDGY